MPKSQRRKLAGSTVVISGAASGIGRSLARRLSGHGCPVALSDIDETGLKETAASLTGPVLTQALDVSDAAAQREFADQERRWMPAPLVAVFNNAGVATALLKTAPSGAGIHRRAWSANSRCAAASLTSSA